MRSAALRSRLVTIASLTAAVACGSSGTSDTGSTGAIGPSAQGGAGGGASGDAGASAGGASGNAGAFAGGASGNAGASAGGASGNAGASAGGASGASGASGANAGGAPGPVPCPPLSSDPHVTCYGGQGDLPNGCGAGTSGGDMGCYVPGANGAPASPCLAADDPALAALLSSPCQSFSEIQGPATCRLATFVPPNDPPTPACCYAAKVQGMCKARPFFLAGVMRVASLARREEWT